MLRITQSASSAAAKSYYVSSLDREDYYSDGQEIVGAWGGRLAEKLGLSGQVERDAFNKLCDNLNPATGENLTARTNENRRVGYDINFHCPKSVSVLYALSNDEKILAAFRASVRETMQDLEKDMQARVRSGGKNENRKTGNMLWGEFVHFTARPVGGIPDPHLHAHCFAFNATFDESEKKIKAGQFGDIKRDASYYEAGFHARLASRLASLGYGIERTAKGWEIAGVSRPVIEKFSRRAAGIEKLALEKGIVSNKEKDKLAARTREGKREGQSLADLKKTWAAWLSGDESDALRRVKELGQKSPEISDAGAVDYALLHAFERSSVVSEKRFLAEALRRGVGSVSVEGVKEQAKQRSAILSQDVDGQTFTTTKRVLNEEKAMIAAAARRRGNYAPLFAKTPGLSSYLSDEQKNAVRHVLGSRDGVTAIRGAAGVGKTSLMRETVGHIEKTGKRVFTFAPTANASRGVLRSEGFENADTLASLLNDQTKQDAIKNNVIWIDEAGQVGAKTMRQVLELAEKQNARVILSGDVRQHSSVERGDSLRILENNGGLKSVEVVGIRRQKGAYREAVQDLSKGDAAAGFDKLERLGAVVETTDAGERYAALARDYAETIKAGKTALVVSPTHGEGEKVTSAVRSELRAGGKLGNDEKDVMRLRNLSWTQAERSDVKNYAPGLVVQFERNSKGVKIGEKMVVTGISDGKVTAEKENGAKLVLPLDNAKNFSVYAPESLPLASGDKVRITKNGFCSGKGGKHRLNNGAVFEVAGFNKSGDIKLNNGWTVSKDFGHLSHGYCLTSHASQGSTVDRVFIAQSSASAPAASKEQFYVSASRGRESVKIYTDNRETLRESVGASSVRLSAVELMKNTKEKEKCAGAPVGGFGGEKRLDKPKLWQMIKPAKDETQRKTQIVQQAQTVARLKNRARVLLAQTTNKVKSKTKELVADFRQKALDRQKNRGMDYER